MTNREYRKLRNSCIKEARAIADSNVPDWETVPEGGKLWNGYFSLAMENLVKERLSGQENS